MRESSFCSDERYGLWLSGRITYTCVLTVLRAAMIILRGRVAYGGPVRAENRFRLILPMPKSKGVSLGAGSSQSDHDDYDEYDSYEAARRMRKALQGIPEDTEGAEGEMTRGGWNDLYT